LAAAEVTGGDGPAPERRRLLAALVAVGLVAGTVAVLAATRHSPVTTSPGTPAPVAATATTLKPPASAVSPATSFPHGLVPVVAGATQAEATERLVQAGMAPGTVRRINDDKVPDGHAIGTRPSAGATLRPGERVTLVVSTGASPRSVTDLIAIIDANPRAAGPRAPGYRERLARLQTMDGRRRQAEAADLLRIAQAGAANGDFSPGFSADAVQVLRRLA
jgi:hypothetical protein